MAQIQVNVRVTDEVAEVLGVAASLDDLSLSEFVRRHVESLASELRRDPDVEDVLRVRARRKAARSGSVTDLRTRRGRKNGDASA